MKGNSMHIVDDPDEVAAEADFARGVPLPLVSLYFERGERDRAAAIARLGLAVENCPDRVRIEEILDLCSAPPDDWKSVLDEFAETPSLDRWKELMQFVPDDLRYQRQRNGIRYLRKRGVESNLLFRCACDVGLTPDSIELVEDGLVSVETVLARAGEAGPARGAYVGLAAQAAFLGGDFVGTIRLLREAISLETDLISALPFIWFVHERATPAQREALNRAGIGSSDYG
jgi:hypothetical protein